MKKSIISLLVGSVALLGSALPALAASNTTSVDASMIGQLHKGAKGDSVKFLQALLAADVQIYPEGLITGYFGNLTALAVQRFQKKHGLETVGNVGPRTLAQLAREIQDHPLGLQAGNGTTTPQTCAIVPPGHLIAPGWLRTQGGVVPIIPTCQVLPPGIARQLGTTTPPTPDTTAPVLSSILVSNLASTSATVNWNTNELADSTVWFSTSTPVVLASPTASTTSAALVTTHALSLTALASSTTYFFAVESKDGAGNTATSTTLSFTTLP